MKEAGLFSGQLGNIRTIPSTLLEKSGKYLLWGETIGTVRNVSNVSLEDVFSRSLRFNGERRNGVRNVSDVSRGRALSIHRLRCVHRYRPAHARLRPLLPIKRLFACFLRMYYQDKFLPGSSFLCNPKNLSI